LLYLIYALGTNTFAFTRSLAVAGLVFIPLLLAATAELQPPGAWEDFLTIAGIWLAVKPLPNPLGCSLSHWLWPFPGGRLAYVFTVMMCVNIALATFVLVRRVNGTGYSIGWGHYWTFFILAGFLAFAGIAIPLGHAIRFIQFEPQWSQLKSLPLVSLVILFFTAWTAVFLFRVLLQNVLLR